MRRDRGESTGLRERSRTGTEKMMKRYRKDSEQEHMPEVTASEKKKQKIQWLREETKR